MVDQKIVDFIKKMVKDGISLNTIKSQLKERGWPENEINKAIQSAVPSEIPVSKTSKNPEETLKEILPDLKEEKSKTFCWKCGTENDGAAKACKHCGVNLQEIPKEEKEESELKVALSEYTLIKKIVWTGISIVGVFFLFIALLIQLKGFPALEGLSSEYHYKLQEYKSLIISVPKVINILGFVLIILGLLKIFKRKKRIQKLMLSAYAFLTILILRAFMTGEYFTWRFWWIIIFLGLSAIFWIMWMREQKV